MALAILTVMPQSSHSEDICFLGLPDFESIQYTALKFFLLHAVEARILLVELIQEFGAVLRDFIPVILVDKLRR